MGRNKTLPPSTFVGVLIPDSMLAMLDANRFEGRKGCSAFSRSEAIRDAIAKGLGISWKPVEQPKEEKVDAKPQKSIFATEITTDELAKEYLYQWARLINTEANRTTKFHWTKQVSKTANNFGIPYDVALHFRRYNLSADEVITYLGANFGLDKDYTSLDLYNLFIRAIVK